MRLAVARSLAACTTTAWPVLALDLVSPDLKGPQQLGHASGPTASNDMPYGHGATGSDDDLPPPRAYGDYGSNPALYHAKARALRRERRADGARPPPLTYGEWDECRRRCQ